jgi:hypothetical protein
LLKCWELLSAQLDLGKTGGYDKNTMSLGPWKCQESMILPSLGMVLTAETHHWFLQGKGIFTGALWGARGNQQQEP